MKKILFLLLSVFIFSCSKEEKPDETNTPDFEISPAFTTATNTFAFDFWKIAENDIAKNYILSPLSLNIALGMVLNGADGQTRQEILNTLGYEGIESNEINESYHQLINKLPHIDSNVTNFTANSVWVKKELEVKDPFIDNLKKYFSAEVFTRDFTNPAVAGEVNRWANKNTKGKIDNVIDTIEPEQVLFLINALYFKGDWKTIFPESNTKKDKFYGLSGVTNQDFMHVTAEFPYLQNEYFSAAELSYGNGEYAFIAILPNKGMTGEILSRLSYDSWAEMTSSFYPRKMEVILPKFTLETDMQLNEVIQKMGISRAFGEDAEFDEISEEEELSIDFINQTVFIGVDEKGSEAAAVTNVGFRITTDAITITPQFKLDRPFLFAIVEKSTNTIQFFGKVADF